jgi:uncharacterized protein (TIGR02466 family)
MTAPAPAFAAADPTFGEPVRLWPTPLYAATMPGHQAVNGQLCELIVAAEQTDTSVSLAVIAARKSSPDLLLWNHPAVTVLRGWILSAVSALAFDILGADAAHAGEVVAEAWAVVYRDGGSHRLHTHHDAAISGVYYVHTAGLAEGTGQVQFIDPRPAALARHASPQPTQPVQPHPGLLLAFPSWAPHLVQATHGTDPRICIAFNAAFTTSDPAAAR